jgi:hypothetical protein
MNPYPVLQRDPCDKQSALRHNKHPALSYRGTGVGGMQRVGVISVGGLCSQRRFTYILAQLWRVYIDTNMCVSALFPCAMWWAPQVLTVSINNRVSEAENRYSDVFVNCDALKACFGGRESWG